MYLLFRKIHRLGMFATTIIIVVMGATGIVLKYPRFFSELLQIGVVRGLHNNLSIIATIALFVMTISGIAMYIFPFLKRK